MAESSYNMVQDSSPYVPKDHYYKYDLGWLIQTIQQVESELSQAIDLRTIHYADPIQWDITTQYQANTVVVDNKTGNAYISSQNVPAGVLLTDTNYWNVIFNYNSAFHKLMEQFATDEQYNSTASRNYIKNEYLWKEAQLYKTLKAINEADAFREGVNIEAVQYMPENASKVNVTEECLYLDGVTEE